MFILVSARLSEEDAYSVNHDLLAIDKLFDFLMKHFRESLTNWTMHSWQHEYKSQMNSWKSYIQLSIKKGSISSFMMGLDLFIYLFICLFIYLSTDYEII
jgi:hypothetical protein